MRTLQVSPQGRAGRREVAPGRARRSPRAWLCGARSGAAADTHGTVRPRLMQRRREGVGDAGNPPAGAAAGRGAACPRRGRGAGPRLAAVAQQPRRRCGTGRGIPAAGSAGLWYPRHLQFIAFYRNGFSLGWCCVPPPAPPFGVYCIEP